MQMSNEEIVRDYNQAANKSKQIKVLAELNCVSPGEIRAVLAAAGVAGVKKPDRIRPRKPDADPQHPQEATPEESIYVRIEAILAALPENASGYAREAAKNLVAALFREYLDQRLGKEARDDA